MPRGQPVKLYPCWSSLASVGNVEGKEKAEWGRGRMAMPVGWLGEVVEVQIWLLGQILTPVLWSPNPGCLDFSLLFRVDAIVLL